MSSTATPHTTTTTATQPTSGEAAGATAGDKIKGAYNAIHGGLEKLRGEALSAADAAGDQAKETQTHGTTARETKNVDTATNGDAEMKAGIAALYK